MDKLQLVINTLNRIEVSGKENLNRMLGCIQALEEMKEAEHDSHDEQGQDHTH